MEWIFFRKALLLPRGFFRRLWGANPAGGVTCFPSPSSKRGACSVLQNEAPGIALGKGCNLLKQTFPFAQLHPAACAW